MPSRSTTIRTPNNPSRFLTIEQVATELGVGVDPVYALVQTGSLPAIKIGGLEVWRVERRTLEDCIARAYARANGSPVGHPFPGQILALVALLGPAQA